MAEDLQEAMVSPDLFQGIYEQVLGIPTAGRSRYSNWLADRWQDAVQQWAIATSPELRRDFDRVNMQAGLEGQTEGRLMDGVRYAQDLSFRDWLNQVKGTTAMFGPSSQFRGGTDSITDIAERTPAARLNELMAGIQEKKGDVAAGLFNYATRRNLQNRFGQMAGAGMFRQAMSPEALRQYQVEQAQLQDRFQMDRALPGYGTVIEPDTFLQSRIANLRSRYGF